MVELRIAGTDDATEVGRIFAAGFSDDPVFTWVFDAPDREVKLRTFFGFLAHESLVPQGRTYLTSRCAAAWEPPDAPDWPDERGERFSTALQAVSSPEELERLSILSNAVGSHHPQGSLWHLAIFATEPAGRAQGLGTEVLQRSLQMVDDSGLPAYLESTNPRNVSIYRRHGFEATGRIDLPGGPALTAMRRPGHAG
ncbi:MAG: hypothetical protein AVDCRST_MAG50-2827 [uncultured Acidimicrobiales bacterium]|uniref:N-acetyltransferase domain-containing protein n=1 Tax=uncultured Acidimicrobiales bacterium TaxID=310071 RepID=A0A6J4IYH3_9ACTN|nr:MAG: hypothetical protein AVDCRST_MAG50-2827 [uncultured Acidimicrobiales bacterium]